MVKVDEVEGNGAYVSLLEYDNSQGMITPNEYTAKSIRGLNKAIRVGKTEVV